jgi:hypothetical protein
LVLQEFLLSHMNFRSVIVHYFWKCHWNLG